MLAAIDDKVWWYTARSTGMVSWVLISASVVWGVLLAGRLVKVAGAPRWLDDLHRFLGGLSVIFVMVHISALVADNFIYFGWKEIVIPFASDYETGAVAAGVVATYLLLAVELTSLARKRMPRKWWKYTHFASYALWVLGTIHGIFAGTDSDTAVFIWGAIAVSAVTAIAIISRGMSAVGKQRKRAARQAA